MNIKEVIFFFGNDFKKIKNRIIFTFLSIFIFRIGSFIPIPGININLLSNILEHKNNVFFDIFNIFSGGSLLHVSVLMLGIMPYISASIVMQLLTFTCNYFTQLNKEGEYGKSIINIYTRILTLLLSIIQAVMIVLTFEKFNYFENIIYHTNSLFYCIFVLSLVVGTMLLMWLGEKISEYGIGNGVSLIIFTGILSSIPKNIYFFLKDIKFTKLVFLNFLLLSFLLLVVVFFIVFIEKAKRKILVQYGTKRENNKNYIFNLEKNIYLPIKINISGIIPSIFASTIIILPLFLFLWLNIFFKKKIFFILSNYFYYDHYLYLFLFFILVIFFCFFYTFLVFNPHNITMDFQKSGIYIIGVRPGNKTRLYINNIVFRLTLFNSIYICIVCLIPNLFYELIGFSFYFSGTSLLIVVVVTIEIITQIKSLIMFNKYLLLFKKYNI